MKIAFDVSPLSHPLLGIGNYIRGSLAGLAEASADSHEIVAFAPTSPQGMKAIPRVLAGIPVETKLVLLPFAVALVKSEGVSIRFEQEDGKTGRKEQ